MARKLKLFLCDLVHDTLGVGTFTFPLNVGLLSAYLKKFHKDELDIRLFKFPERLIQALKTDAPDLVGFGNYTWNINLNRTLSEIARELHPNAVQVFGGPNLDYTEAGIRRFFTRTPAADFYIPLQGEPGMLLLVERLLSERSIGKLKSAPLDGAIFLDRDSGAVVQGAALKRIKNPDTIPSPWLTGELDAFFEDRLMPIVETNRGCPYTCTFCAQGLSAGHAMEFFSLDRVKEEIRYIAGRVKHTNIMIFADSNFGIHKRDSELADFLLAVQRETGYPRRFSMNWAKNQPKILDLGIKLSGSTMFIVSLQSLDEKVLANAKRRNVDLNVFRGIVERMNEMGGISGTEIILGLPGETRESHLSTLRQLFDWQVSYIIGYNALLLEGTEMSMRREDFGIATRFRLSDGCFGRYEGRLAFDMEEGVMSQDSMGMDELLSIRPVHWLIWFMWNYRFHFGYLKMLQAEGINPLDFVLALLDTLAGTGAKPGVNGIFEDFRAESYAEWFESPEALFARYSAPESFADLLSGRQGGKMNAKYMWRVLLEDHAGFQDAVLATGLRLCRERGVGLPEELHRELLDFLRAKVLDFSREPDDLEEEFSREFHWDFWAWEQARFQGHVQDFARPGGVRFRFYFDPDQREALKKNIAQYRHESKLVTYRKMGEFMNMNDLWYKVQPQPNMLP